MPANIGDAFSSSFGGPSQSSVDSAVNNRNQLEQTLQGQNQGFLSNYQNSQNQFFQGQRDQFGGLVNQLQGVLGSQQKLPDLYTQYSQQNNVPNLQKALSGITNQSLNVNDQLQNLTSDVNSRVKDSLVTDAQRRGEISNESVPLQTALGRLTQGSSALGQQLQTALGNTTNQVGLQQQQYQKDLMPVQTQINEFADQAAREFSGFNNEKQVEYTTLLDNLQRQRSMSDSDLARLRSLQDQSTQFNQSKNLLSQQIQGQIQVARAGQGYQQGLNQQIMDAFTKSLGGSGGGNPTPNQGTDPNATAASIFSLGSPTAKTSPINYSNYLQLPQTMTAGTPDNIPLTNSGSGVDFSSMLGNSNNGTGSNNMSFNDPYSNSLRLRAGM